MKIADILGAGWASTLSQAVAPVFAKVASPAVAVSTRTQVEGVVTASREAQNEYFARCAAEAKAAAARRENDMEAIASRKEERIYSAKDAEEIAELFASAVRKQVFLASRMKAALAAKEAAIKARRIMTHFRALADKFVRLVGGVSSRILKALNMKSEAAFWSIIAQDGGKSLEQRLAAALVSG